MILFLSYSLKFNPGFLFFEQNDPYYQYARDTLACFVCLLLIIIYLLKTFKCIIPHDFSFYVRDLFLFSFEKLTRIFYCCCELFLLKQRNVKCFISYLISKYLHGSTFVHVENLLVHLVT